MNLFCTVKNVLIKSVQHFEDISYAYGCDCDLPF